MRFELEEAGTTTSTASDDPTSFSVVVATLDRTDLLADTLKSLAACRPLPDEVIVVDGDRRRSAEPVVAELQRAGGDLRTLYVASEPGLTRQRNRGLDVASGDVVVFVDDDVAFTEDIFAALRHAYRDPSVVGATGRVIEKRAHRFGHKHSMWRRWLPGGGKEGSFTRYGYPRRGFDPDVPRDVEFMQGCLMSTRTDVARRVRFDEKLTGYALAEDEDFSYRVSRVGRISYVPDAVIHHKNVGFTTQDARAFGRSVVVNRAYLFRKNFTASKLARLQFALLVAMLIVHRIVNREWQGAKGVIEGAVMAWRERRSTSPA